jgi:hypothetical protein
MSHRRNLDKFVDLDKFIDLDKFVDEFRARQQNIVFADAVRNKARQSDDKGQNTHASCVILLL